MNTNFEKAMNAAGKAADAALQTTRALVEKGRDKVEEYQLRRRLSGAQRRLGILAYTLHKAGETNDKLVARYVEEIDILLTELAERKAADSKDTALVPAENKGSGAQEDAMFCGGGAKDTSSP